jgi:hypothetical protein
MPSSGAESWRQLVNRCAVWRAAHDTSRTVIVKRMSSSQPHNVQVRVLASAMILPTVIPDNGPSVGLLRPRPAIRRLPASRATSGRFAASDAWRELARQPGGFEETRCGAQVLLGSALAAPCDCPGQIVSAPDVTTSAQAAARLSGPVGVRGLGAVRVGYRNLALIEPRRTPAPVLWPGALKRGYRLSVSYNIRHVSTSLDSPSHTASVSAPRHTVHRSCAQATPASRACGWRDVTRDGRPASPRAQATCVCRLARANWLFGELRCQLGHVRRPDGCVRRIKRLVPELGKA